MPKPELIARQSAHPTGWLGHLVARVMALDTAAANDWTLGFLEAKPGDDVLELGCGHGRALRKVADAVVPGGGTAVGVDPSAVMLGVARGHLRHHITAGRVRVERGDSQHVPVPDAAFDKLFSVHTLYFWPDLAAGLAECRRALRPGGEMLHAFHSADNPRKTAELPPSVYTMRSDVEMRAALERAGFGEIELHIHPKTELRLARARA